MKRKNTKNGAEDFGKVRMINMARTVRLLIQLFSGGLVLVFGWLKLKDIEIGITVTDITANALLKLSLFLYFTCWVLGTNNDVNDQELVHEKAPNGGVVPPAGYTLIFMIALVFGFMCYVHDYKTFSLLLLLFWCVNVLGWYYLVNSVYARDVTSALKKYKEDNMYYKYEILRVTNEYLSGNWQWHRFMVGFSIIAVNFFLAYTEFPMKISMLIGFKSPDIITASGFIVYIVVMEIWIWIKRARVKTSFSMIDLFEGKYKILPINNL